jgi:general secretion pathway protein D
MVRTELARTELLNPKVRGPIEVSRPVTKQARIRLMRWFARIRFDRIWFASILAAGLLLTSTAFAGSDDSVPPVTCSSEVPGGISCIVTRKEVREARTAYARGMKLQSENQLEEAFAQFDEASRLSPQDMQFLTARELTKGRLVFKHIERGNDLLVNNQRIPAAAEFRAALDLDPENQFAADRLQEATRPPDSRPIQPTALENAEEIRLAPPSKHADFKFKGDVRGLFTEIASSYGLTVEFDDSVQNKQVRFFIDDVDFPTAIKLASQVSKSMWSALDTTRFIVANDTPENHKQFDHMSFQTLLLPPHISTQEVNDYLLALRNMLDIKYITSDLNADTVAIRAPQPLLAGAVRMLDQFRNEKPQVMFNLQVFEINHDLTRNIGLHVPNTFNLYNIPAVALVGLGSQNISQLVNQLISSGGINQAGSTGLSGLLAQLGGGGAGGANSIFSQPLATFGGGLTLSGLSLDQLAAALSINESWSRSLSDVDLRTGQGADATFHLGERYPIQNASYAPIFNSPQISQVLGNQSYVPPFPSVSYEDIGLNIKLTPVVHGDNSVSVHLAMQVRSLTGASSNGVPVISNKEYEGGLNLRDGDKVVLAGQVSKSDTLSLSGIPGFGFFPGLNQLMVSNSRQINDDELMIVITAHVLSNFDRSTAPIWISEK